MKKAVEAILKPSGSPAARRAPLELTFVAKRSVVKKSLLYNFIEKHRLDVEPRLEPR